MRQSGVRISSAPYDRLTTGVLDVANTLLERFHMMEVLREDVACYSTEGGV